MFPYRTPSGVTYRNHRFHHWRLINALVLIKNSLCRDHFVVPLFPIGDEQVVSVITIAIVPNICNFIIPFPVTPDPTRVSRKAQKHVSTLLHVAP